MANAKTGGQEITRDVFFHTQVFSQPKKEFCIYTTLLVRGYQGRDTITNIIEH